MDGRYGYREDEMRTGRHPLHPYRLVRNPGLWIAVIVPVLGVLAAEFDLRYAHKDAFVIMHAQDSLSLILLRQDVQRQGAQIDALTQQVDALDTRVHQLICSVKITEGCR